MNFRAQSLRAIKWSVIGYYSEQVFVFGASVVLARILEPEDFGLLAMLSFFTAIVQAVGDFGLTNSLIQKKHVTEADKSTVFWVALAMGLVMAGAYFWGSSWVASFYGRTELSDIMRWGALTILLDTFAAVQRTMLKKEINFKVLSVCRLISIVGGIILAITTALLGWGVWALVAQSVGSTFLSAIIYWLVSPWRPSFIFKVQSLKSLMGVGLPVFGANMADYLVARIDGLLIGKWFTPSDVGYYSRGMSLTRMPVQYMVSGVQRTIFPLLASIQDQKEKLEKSYQKATDLTGFWIFPTSFGLAVMAYPLVLFLYGAKWLPAVPLVEVLALSGPLLTWSMMQTSVLVAMGNAKEVFWQSIWRSMFLLAGLFLGSNWGLLGMVSGRLLAEVFTGFLRCRDVEKVLGFKQGDEMRRMFKPLGSTLIMACVIWGLDKLLFWPLLLKLAVLIPVGASVYLIASWWLQREALKESWAIGLTFIRRKNESH